MLRTLVHLFIGISAQIGAVQDPGQMVVVLDASDRMAQPVVAGSTTYDIAGAALVEELADGRDTRPELRVGLRLAGWNQCDEAFIAIEPGEVDPDNWRTAIEDRAPHGTCPLIPSVVAALDDFEDFPGPARVVVITAGVDDCGGTPLQVAEAMAERDVAVDLRIVGLLLSEEASAFFGNVPLRNVRKPDQLGTALQWALFEGWSEEPADSEPTEPLPPSAALEAPDRVDAGAALQVRWMGPDAAEDFISIAEAADPGDSYLEWIRCENGNPALLTAPVEPGSYELRYVGGIDGLVLALSPLEVVAVSIELDAPATVIAGRRFEISWTGSTIPGDFVALSRPKTPPRLFLDWADTLTGSPVTLAAPHKPGVYELRFIRKSGLEILARKFVEVLE